MKNLAGAFKGRHQTPEVTLQRSLCSCFNYGGPPGHCSAPSCWKSLPTNCQGFIPPPCAVATSGFHPNFTCQRSSSQVGWNNVFHPWPVCLATSNTSPKVAYTCRVTLFSLFCMEVPNNESSLFGGTRAAPQSWHKIQTAGIYSPWNSWCSEEQHSLS